MDTLAKWFLKVLEVSPTLRMSLWARDFTTCAHFDRNELGLAYLVSNCKPWVSSVHKGHVDSLWLGRRAKKRSPPCLCDATACDLNQWEKKVITVNWIYIYLMDLILHILVMLISQYWKKFTDQFFMFLPVWIKECYLFSLFMEHWNIEEWNCIIFWNYYLSLKWAIEGCCNTHKKRKWR